MADENVNNGNNGQDRLDAIRDMNGSLKFSSWLQANYSATLSEDERIDAWNKFLATHPAEKEALNKRKGISNPTDPENTKEKWDKNPEPTQVLDMEDILKPKVKTKQEKDITPNDAEVVNVDDRPNAPEIEVNDAPRERRSDDDKGRTGNASTVKNDPDSKKVEKEEEGKGPFQEGDIIDYMYKEWLIAGMNWVWVKVDKKVREWGTTAYLAFLDGMEKRRAERDKKKAEGKPTVSLDRYLETQTRVGNVMTASRETISNRTDALIEAFDHIEKGQFDKLNLDGLDEKQKEQMLKAFKSLGNNDLDNITVEGLTNERKEELKKKLKKSGNDNLLQMMAKDNKEQLGNMKDNLMILSSIAANYATAKIGEAQAKDKNFDPKTANLEKEYYKQAMAMMVARLKEEKDQAKWRKELEELSTKAKKSTDYKMDHDLHNEFGVIPRENKSLLKMEEMMKPKEGQERNPEKEKRDLYNILMDNSASKESEASILKMMMEKEKFVDFSQANNDARQEYLNRVKKKSQSKNNDNKKQSDKEITPIDAPRKGTHKNPLKGKDLKNVIKQRG